MQHMDFWPENTFRLGYWHNSQQLILLLDLFGKVAFKLYVSNFYICYPLAAALAKRDEVLFAK